jgi:demethylmenaquinone methyltransferase/2-methoxy-6-polyprenyl-1,4-benzoquinol methylase
MDFDSNRRARRLFDGIASQYDVLPEVMSFFQFGLWRRFLISRLTVRPGDSVLDLGTGTAKIAAQIAKTFDARVVGVDLSAEMLHGAQRRISNRQLDGKVSLLMGRAENLAFPDGRFDAVCFTYLLRYVDDPSATLGEIVRVLKPGGCLLSLEFGVPNNILARGLWHVYTKAALPLATRVLSPGWRELGTFLGPSVSAFCRSYPPERLRQMWVDRGVLDVRIKRLSLGGGVVMWGTKHADGS